MNAQYMNKSNSNHSDKTNYYQRRCKHYIQLFTIKLLLILIKLFNLKETVLQIFNLCNLDPIMNY
jgi:hypothetical protein